MLAPARHTLLRRWLTANTTGAGKIRAATPSSWTVADKTGSGRYGTDNDVAVVWPHRRAPVVIAVMTTRRTAGARPDDALIERAAGAVLDAL